MSTRQFLINNQIILGTVATEKSMCSCGEELGEGRHTTWCNGSGMMQFVLYTKKGKRHRCPLNLAIEITMEEREAA
ncbi:MAG: hypothetical protein KC736_04325 [Candidatus Moranbacteria bacterium]|nr:hypothetical protein [Candidatus Moranbacteria bacterium]